MNSTNRGRRCETSLVTLPRHHLTNHQFWAHLELVSKRWCLGKVAAACLIRMWFVSDLLHFQWMSSRCLEISANVLEHGEPARVFLVRRQPLRHWNSVCHISNLNSFNTDSSVFFIRNLIKMQIIEYMSKDNWSIRFVPPWLPTLRELSFSLEFFWCDAPWKLSKRQIVADPLMPHHVGKFSTPCEVLVARAAAWDTQVSTVGQAH